MTDTTPDRAHDDELLSAHLDGELAPDEATRLEARLAAEPALRARLGALRAAAATVGTGVPAPSPVARERAVAEAMWAAGQAGGDAPAARVVDIGERRRRRALVAMSAAAVVLVVALAVPLLRSGGDGEDAGTMAAGRDANEAEGDGDQTAATEEAAATADEGGPAGAGGAPVFGRDLGRLASPDEVAAAVTAALAAADASGSADTTVQTESGETAPGADAAAHCEEPARASVPDAAGLVLSGVAEFAGQDAYVLVFATTTGTRQAVVVGTVACDVLAGPLDLGP